MAAHSSQIVLDHVSDVNGAELHRLAKLYPFPDFVKTANLQETRQPSNLAVAAYADPINKLYPCHNAASTWLSTLFFAEKQGSYHAKNAARVQGRLEHFVRYWGIKSAVDAVHTKFAEYHKDADSLLPDADFGFVWQGDNGVKQRFLRMKNAAEVKAAADYLFTHIDEIPYSDRNVIANKVMQKAAKYGASLGTHEQFVEKQAGMGVCEPSEVVAMIRDRAKIASDPGVREKLAALAETVKNKPRFSFQGDMLVKLAATLDAVDRGMGLVGKYTDIIKRPEDVCFKITYKEAQAGVGAACALTTGNVYDKTQFTKIARTDISALFGEDFATQVGHGLNVDVEKLAEVAETFPRPDAELFEKLLHETGIPPISTKSAADRRGLDMAAMRELAGAY